MSQSRTRETPVEPNISLRTALRETARLTSTATRVGKRNVIAWNGSFELSHPQFTTPAIGPALGFTFFECLLKSLTRPFVLACRSLSEQPACRAAFLPPG